MINLKKPQRILWFENIGFLAIIILSWANELLDLPRHVFGGDTRVNWRESAMETFIVLMVWVLVHLLTKKLLSRLHYLEGFLRVCAWCKKIGHEDTWLPLELYFSTGYDVQTSHGICPACKEKLLSNKTNAAEP